MEQDYPVQVRARLDERLSRWLWLVRKLHSLARRKYRSSFLEIYC